MIPNCHETRVYVTGTVRRHGRESGTNALADINTEENILFVPWWEIHHSKWVA